MYIDIFFFIQLFLYVFIAPIKQNIISDTSSKTRD